MKKYLLLIVSLFFIGISNVYAVDEIALSIDENNVITVKDAVANTEITENKTDYYDFSNNTLTLKENIKYSNITFINNLTITTNDKLVKVASIYTKENNVLNLTNFNGEIYISNDTYKRIEYSSGWNLKPSSHQGIYSKGNINIKDSTTIYDVGTYPYVYTDNDGTLSIKDSDFSVYNVQVERMDVDNSTLTLVTGQGNDTTLNSIVKDSTINSSDFNFKNKLVIDNSILNIDSFFISNETKITNSEINSRNIYTENVEESNNLFTNDTINANYLSGHHYATNYFTNCTIKITGVWPESRLIFKESNIESQDLTCARGMEFYDSTVKVTEQFRVSEQDIYIENSKVTLTKNDIANNVMFEVKTDLVVKNSTILLDGYTTIAGNASFDNSYFKVKTTHDEDKITNVGYDFSTNTSLSVGGILTLTNSRVVLESSGVVPSLGVKGSVVIKDNYSKFRDTNGKELDIVKVTVSDENFLKNTYSSSRIQYNDNLGKSYYTDGEEVYTLGENDNITTNCYINAYNEYKFNIENGTWSDKSTSTIIQKVLVGEEFTYPTGMIANKNYADGKWSKISDNEYTYSYVKVINPKTGVKSISLLIAIAIIGILILSINENTFSRFKQI